MSTPSIRNRFLSCLRNRQGKKEGYTLKVKEADISVKLEMLPASTDPADVQAMAERIGCKGSVKDEDGMLVGTGNKTFLPGADAAGIVADMRALAVGLSAEGETLNDPPAGPDSTANVINAKERELTDAITDAAKRGAGVEESERIIDDATGTDAPKRNKRKPKGETADAPAENVTA